MSVDSSSSHEPGGLPPPLAGDALSELFAAPTSPDVPNSNLLAQCDVSEFDRRGIISDRLANLDDSSTRLGRELGSRIVLGQEVDVAFQQDLAAHGIQVDETMDRRRITDVLSARINALSHERGPEGIFTNLALEKKTTDEGERRMRGEETLVLIKAGLLELGVQEITSGNIREGGIVVAGARVPIFSYPEWFSQGLATALRQYNVAQMTEGDLPTLTLIKNLYPLVGVYGAEAEMAKAAVDPEALDGLQYAQRKIWDATDKITQLEEEKKSQEAEAEHNRQLTASREHDFQGSYGFSEAATRNMLRRERTGIFLDTNGDRLMGNMLRFDVSIGRGYLDGQSGGSDRPHERVENIMMTLRALSDEDFLARASSDFSNRNSKNYIYNDGTSHLRGMLANMPPENAQAAVREQMERGISAAAFGVLRAVVEHDSGGTQGEDRRLLTVARGIAQIVGQGRAVELFSTNDRAQLEQAFSRTQVQFRDELIKYLAELATRNPERATALGNALRVEVKTADIEIKQRAEAKTQEMQEADQQFAMVENALIDAREFRDRFPGVEENIRVVQELAYIQPEQLGNFLKVVGSGESQQLVINGVMQSEYQRQQGQLREDLQQSALSPEERLSLQRRLAEVDLRLRFFEQIQNRLANLDINHAHIITSSGILGFGRTITRAYDEPEGNSGAAPDFFNNGLLQLREALSRMETIASRVEQLRTQDHVAAKGEMVTAQADLQKIQGQIEHAVSQADTVTTQGVEYGINRIFERAGLLHTLSSRKGSPFFGLFQRRRK